MARAKSEGEDSINSISGISVRKVSEAWNVRDAGCLPSPWPLDLTLKGQNNNQSELKM
jgi:hypothetical protein